MQTVLAAVVVLSGNFLLPTQESRIANEYVKWIVRTIKENT